MKRAEKREQIKSLQHINLLIMTCSGVIIFLLVAQIAAAFPTPQQEDHYSDLDSNKLSRTEVTDIPTASTDVSSNTIVGTTEDGSGSSLGDEKEVALCNKSSKAFDNSRNSENETNASPTENYIPIEELPRICSVPKTFTIVYTE